MISPVQSGEWLNIKIKLTLCVPVIVFLCVFLAEPPRLNVCQREFLSPSRPRLRILGWLAGTGVEGGLEQSVLAQSDSGVRSDQLADWMVELEWSGVVMDLTVISLLSLLSQQTVMSGQASRQN